MIVLEQETCDVDAVLAHGEVQRLAILIVGSRQRRVRRDQRLDGREIAGNARLKQRPHIGAAPGGPQELLVGLELRRVQHAALRRHGLEQDILTNHQGDKYPTVFLALFEKK